eukprot:gene16954-biopygen18840
MTGKRPHPCASARRGAGGEAVWPGSWRLFNRSRPYVGAAVAAAAPAVAAGVVAVAIAVVVVAVAAAAAVVA